MRHTYWPIRDTIAMVTTRVGHSKRTKKGDGGGGFDCSQTCVCLCVGVYVCVCVMTHATNHSLGMAFSSRGMQEPTWASRFTHEGVSAPHIVCTGGGRLVFIIRATYIKHMYANYSIGSYGCIKQLILYVTCE